MYFQQAEREAKMIPTISITPATEHLYHQYAGELQPQHTYIELDLRNGSMTADYDGEIGGGVPAAVWNGDVIRLPLPNVALLPSTINEIMSDIVDDAQKLVDMYHCDEVDQATLNEEIYSLVCRTESRAYDPDECLTVMHPAKWFEAITTYTDTAILIDDGTVITAETTDDELDRLAAALSTDIDNDGRPLLLDPPVTEWLTSTRDTLDDDNE